MKYIVLVVGVVFALLVNCFTASAAEQLLNGKQQFFDVNGNPLSGGTVTFYVPGTTTPKNTWQDASETTLNANPVVLDAGGIAVIYGNGRYRQIVRDALGNTIWDTVTAGPLQLTTDEKYPAYDGSNITNLRNAPGITSGTMADSLVRLNGSAKLPPVDGSNLTNLQTANGLVSGTAGNNLVRLDSSARLPAVDGSQLTNLVGRGTNLLINAGFRINQRNYVAGTPTTVANQYTVDRWRIPTIGQSLTFPAGVLAPPGGIEQVVEGVNIDTGNYVLSWGGTATATVNGVPVTNGIPFQLVAYTNTTVRFSSGNFFAPKLEAGTTPTAFELVPVGRELEDCRRYYETGFSDSFVPSNGTNTRITITFSVQKRGSPSMGGTFVISTGSVSVLSVTTSGFTLQGNVPNQGIFGMVATWTANAEF